MVDPHHPAVDAACDRPGPRQVAAEHGTAEAVGRVVAQYCRILADRSICLLVPEAGLSDALGSPAGTGDFLAIAWLASSVATIGGALGAGLESDESVRQAAYSYQPEVIDESRS